jgi:hypothetical protein
MPEITDFYQLEFTGAELNQAAHKLLDGNGIQNADLAKLPAKTILGNNTNAQGNAMYLTVEQLKTLLAIASDITTHNNSASAHGNGITGNAATATKLKAAVNVSIKDKTGANTGAVASFDGSGALVIYLPATIKAELTGNASTATKLKTAVNIGNASFDGSGSLSFDDIGVEATPPHNHLYDGKNLKTVFGSAAAFHNAVAAGDFSKIRVGDYYPLTLSGTIHDQGSDTNKTLSNAVFNMEVAAINPYWKTGDSGELTGAKNHVILCSRDLLPWTLQFRSAATTWFNTEATNPWLGSALYETLNNTTNGLLPIVAASELGAYIYAGPNGKGMRMLLETKAAGATAATGWAWGDRGKLFLPTEREVWGQDVWSEHGYGGGICLQWPIFAQSRRHIIKGLGNGGSRCFWWCESSQADSASDVCVVYCDGYAGGNSAAIPHIGAPVCFLFV